jgi:hypothetical protein
MRCGPLWHEITKISKESEVFILLLRNFTFFVPFLRIIWENIKNAQCELARYLAILRGLKI